MLAVHWTPTTTNSRSGELLLHYQTLVSVLATSRRPDLAAMLKCAVDQSVSRTCLQERKRLYCNKRLRRLLLSDAWSCLRTRGKQ